MPTPSRTDNQTIIVAARALVESEGTSFSVAKLAASVGIKAPSLYKRFEDKAAILAAVEISIIEDLGHAVSRALDAALDDPIVAAARAYRAFALANPGGYGLLFSGAASDDPKVHERRTEALTPVLAALESAKTCGDTLGAARYVTAFLHGFVTMEIAGAFRMGGDVSAAFEESLYRVAKGLGD